MTAGVVLVISRRLLDDHAATRREFVRPRRGAW